MENPTQSDNQNLNPNLIPNIPQNNIYKTLFFVFLGLFLITASIMATLLLTQKPTKSIPVAEIQEEETIPTSTSSKPTEIPADIEPTSSIPKDWKTYNSNLGFSIKAPSSYTFLDYNDSQGDARFYSFDPKSGKYGVGGGVPLNELQSNFRFTNDTLLEGSINTLIEQSEGLRIVSQDDVIVSGYKAKLFKFFNNGDGYIEGMKYFIQLDNKTFNADIHINIETDQKLKDKYFSDFTKIVESIKFN
jgi:hypothetical protein